MHGNKCVIFIYCARALWIKPETLTDGKTLSWWMLLEKKKTKTFPSAYGCGKSGFISILSTEISNEFASFACHPTIQKQAFWCQTTLKIDISSKRRLQFAHRLSCAMALTIRWLGIYTFTYIIIYYMLLLILYAFPVIPSFQFLHFLCA